MLTVLARAEELAVRGADASQGASERAAMATEVDQLLEETVALANTKDNGRYLLGGQETLTAPLTVTRNGAGDITAAAWNPRGVDGAMVLDVAEGVSVQTNIGGTAVLGADTDPTFLPALLVQLRDALATNNQGAVNGVLDSLETARGRITAGRATLGSRLATIDRAQDDNDMATVATKSALSATVDADVARLAADLAQQQTVYQAALHAASQAIQPSLLEFLQ
jgi:flagellar hook-associated protein 3 FlgL